GALRRGGLHLERLLPGAAELLAVQLLREAHARREPAPRALGVGAGLRHGLGRVRTDPAPRRRVGRAEPLRDARPDRRRKLGPRARQSPILVHAERRGAGLRAALGTALLAAPLLEFHVLPRDRAPLRRPSGRRLRRYLRRL